MKEPFLYEDTDNVITDFKSVYNLFEVLQQGDLKKFLEAAEKQDISVELPADTVNFIKKFLFREGAHKNSEQARAIITSATCGKRPSDPVRQDGPPRDRDRGDRGDKPGKDPK